MKVGEQWDIAALPQPEADRQSLVYLSSSHSWIVSSSVFAAKTNHISCISGSTPGRSSGSTLTNKKRNESFTLKVLFW